MTKQERERIQYLLSQFIEGRLNQQEQAVLFTMLDDEPKNEQWVSIFEELIAAEPEVSGYNPALWQSTIESIIGGNEQAISGGNVISLESRRSTWKWIASIAAILLIAFATWMVTNKVSESSTIETQYAQVKKITLPDATEVTLNAKSSLSYSTAWNKNEPREVWLKGEALFDVKHVNRDTLHVEEHERFIVHTDLANVEVLGTVFDIRQRRGKTEIVLEQGKIKVSFVKQDKPDLIMRPGEMVTIAQTQEQVIINNIKAEDYTAWTDKKLVLTNASLIEIVQYLEDNFGKHIILADPTLANRKVEGVFKIDNLDDALLVISKGLNVEIQQRGDSLIFRSK